MPLLQCEADGKSGWRYGASGKCYTHDGSEADSKRAKREAVKQALAIGGGKPPSDLADKLLDLAEDLAELPNSMTLTDFATYLADGTVPDGVVACTMNGTKGFKGDGGPDSACHVHDGTPDSMRSAIAKALKDRGVAGGPPGNRENADREMGDLETVDLTGVELMSIGGPFFGTGSPEGGDFFEPSQLQTIADQTRQVADELRIPLKIGHNKGQKLLKNSGLFTDEQPAAGWIDPRTLRVSGGKLLGDMRKVPKKLAELMKVGAFRTRSVELSRVRSQLQGGKEFDSVITGLALLGAKAPAIRTLNDIVALYSEAEPEHRFSDGLEATAVEIHHWHYTESTEGDTSGMSETVTAPADLSDEQITAFATAFGITEEDADKRREAVLAKFSEHAPKKETTDTPPTPTTPPPSTPPSTEPAAEGGTSLSEAEIKALKDKADLGEKAYNEAAETRRKATVTLAVKQGRIKPADAKSWLDFAERDEDFAFSQLLAMPVNTHQTTTYGADNDGGQGANEAEDKLYAAFAGMTGVRRAVQTTGGKQ